MRVLLIQSYLGRREPPVAPLGLAILAAYLDTHTIQIFDPNVHANPTIDTFAAIEEFKPDFIGISLRNIDTTNYRDPFFYFEHFQQFVRKLKVYGRGIPIGVGGSGYSLFPRQVMERQPEIEIGFFLEAEVAFDTFLRQGEAIANIPGIFYREAGKITFSGHPKRLDFSQLHSPAWDLADLPRYVRWADHDAVGVETKRGCKLACSYCTYPLLSGPELRFKSPEKVIEEIVVLSERYQIPRIFFCDPIFNHPQQHAEAICHAILDSGLKIHWGAYHQDRSLTPEYVNLARQAGCDEFFLSPDAATQQTLRLLNKTTTVESLNRSLDIFSQNRQARVSYNFFIAVPGSGWKDLVAAVCFLIKARFKLGRRLFRWKLSYMRFEPGTTLTRQFFKGDPRDDALLPQKRSELRNLFFRKGDSIFLNSLLLLHFYRGIWFGRRNTVAGEYK